MMGDFIHLSQRFFSMTRINHADWAVAFLSMTKINHADWAMHGPMDIRDLDYFPARGKAGSFTAAARDAYIVQSAMSSAIARLERDVGVRLFDRDLSIGASLVMRCCGTGMASLRGRWPAVSLPGGARCHVSWRVGDDAFGNVWLCSTGITTRITTGCCSARCRSAAGGCWMSAAVPERSQPSLPSEVSRSMPSIVLPG
jgi:hypothetical protein